ncbi:MAG: metallophosphatase domain-containing protein [Planctomycetes bacterium]|nr:metallophosphatase domain-containing protein [Planctomycetota bacterium]MBI3847835.1 metallophosphatase domain-containing protein [Planctomycetota bacterium]
MTLVAISDTHGMHESIALPPGDVFIHAGDLTRSGRIEEVVEFNRWLGSLPYRHRIVIAGNHDFCFERDAEACRRALTHATYLQDQSAVVEGIRIYGSPWQPWFYDWAFNLRRGAEIKQKWDLIPMDTDVLLTHGPPAGFGDLTIAKERVGCADLLEAVRRVKPELHVFGHIHEGYGTFPGDVTTFLNASVCDVAYRPVNPPVTFHYAGNSKR